MSMKNTGEQVDQDPEDHVSFGNEPQGRQPVKPALPLGTSVNYRALNNITVMTSHHPMNISI